jgi:hypothetical protein
MKENIKNPLNALFGAFLQNERKKDTSSSINDIGEKLKMSLSLYKMVESGNAAFNVNKIFNLIHTFPDANLSFDRLSKYFVAQSIADLLINKGGTPRDVINKLSENDEEFRHFFLNIEDYVLYNGESKEIKDDLQEKAIKEINEFLSNSVYPIKDDDKYEANMAHKLSKIPSLSIEILLDFIDSFGTIIPQHFGNIASEWEDKNRSNFKSIDGFYVNPGLIIDKNNLSIYPYSYLRENSFTKIKYIFLSEDEPSILGSKFKTILNQCRSEKKIAKISDNDYKKVHIKSISSKSNHQKLMIKELLRDPIQTGGELQAFWVFTTVKGNKVGFVGVRENDTNKVYNLAYKETIDRDNLFKKLWESIK